MPLDQPIAMLTNKYGPLPGYAYIGIGGVAFFLYRRHQQAKAGNGVTPTDNTGDINATGGQVPPAGYAYDQSGNLTSLATDPATGDPTGTIPILLAT